MTWPFENDTSAVIQKLAHNSMGANKRRNLFAAIAHNRIMKQVSWEQFPLGDCSLSGL